MQRSNHDHFVALQRQRSSSKDLTEMSNAQIRKELFRLCEQFVIDNEITCPESIYQMDGVIGNAYEFLEGMCNIIGYASIKDISETEPDEQDF